MNDPEQRQAASQRLRQLIERIVLMLSTQRGQVDATLHGELGTILSWIEGRAIRKVTKTKTPGGDVTGVSLSVVAGARNYRYRHWLQVPV